MSWVWLLRSAVESESRDTWYCVTASVTAMMNRTTTRPIRATRRRAGSSSLRAVIASSVPAVADRHSVGLERSLERGRKVLDLTGRALALLLLRRELLRGGANLGHRRGDLVGRLALLLGCTQALVEHVRGRAHQLAHLARLLGALLGGHDRGVGLVLDAGDDLADRLGRADAALGELAHLAGHDGEAAPGLSRPRRLDGRVQGQQVGLLGDVVDQLEDLADLLGALAESERALGDRLHLLLHVAHRVAGLLGGGAAGAGAVRDGRGRRVQLLDRRGGLRNRRRLLGGRRRRVTCRRTHLPRRPRQLAGRLADVLDLLHLP